MEKINNILKEKIKADIVKGLMKKRLSFSELLKVTGLRDHGQLNYHLKSLIKENLVEKVDTKYDLTDMGEKFGVYIKQFRMEEIYPLSVVVALIYNKDEDLLMLRRAKKPQKGKWGFPGGRVEIGETLGSSVEREVFEETGLNLKHKKILGFFPSIIKKNGQLNFHVNIIPILMENYDGTKKIILSADEHDEYGFFSKEDIEKADTIVNNKNIIDKISKKKFSFEEIVFDE